MAFLKIWEIVTRSALIFDVNKSHYRINIEFYNTGNISMSFTMYVMQDFISQSLKLF